MEENNEIKAEAETKDFDPFKEEREKLQRDVEAFKRWGCKIPKNLQAKMDELNGKVDFVTCLGKWIEENVCFKYCFMKPFEFWVYKDGRTFFPDYPELTDDEKLEGLKEVKGIFEKYNSEIPDDLDHEIYSIQAFKENICPEMEEYVKGLANYCHIEHDYCVFVKDGEWRRIFVDNLSRIENLPSELIEIMVQDVNSRLFKYNIINLPYPRFARMLPYLENEYSDDDSFHCSIEMLFDDKMYEATISYDKAGDMDGDSYEEQGPYLIWREDFGNVLKERFSDVYLDVIEGNSISSEKLHKTLFFDFDKNKRHIVVNCLYADGNDVC